MNSKSKRIISVIPARSGSKGIPNKNIRILRGRPLVWYAVQNAKNSQFITDIIVTTDSPEIMMIAKSIGVNCKKRADELCGDTVTLDCVVWDAVKDCDCTYDYVITMQPTSPVLKTETLDAAIDFAVKGDYDTVISVVNNPHLSWRVHDGTLVPNYEKRLNRQQLPANYLETGAFVISKRGAVTKSTRIGNKVGVFEISEEEAVDIDSFGDYRLADFLLGKKTVGIYVNGNKERGTGHVYRALELADEFYVKPNIYYDANQTDSEIFGNTSHNLIPVNGIGELLAAIREKGYDIFINDILATSIDYMIALRIALPNSKIINFEDDGEGAYKADLVFNALYSSSDSPHIKAGEKYYISPKLFIFCEPVKIKPKVEAVFVCFGGADPQNYTAMLLDIAKKEKYKGCRFIFAIGRANERINEFTIGTSDNITILHNAPNMPELMSECDIAISSRGRTAYELASLGIPSIIAAQNVRETKHGFVSEDNGFKYLGLAPSAYVLESTLDMYINMSAAERQRFQDIMLSHDLKSGRNRVVDLINTLI